MGRSQRALKSPTLSVRRSNICYLTEIPRQKQELGRWHNQDPVEFFCSTSNQLARIVFPFFFCCCCEANVVSKWKCVCQAFYSPPLSCAPLPNSPTVSFNPLPLNLSWLLTSLARYSPDRRGVGPDQLRARFDIPDATAVTGHKTGKGNI